MSTIHVLIANASGLLYHALEQHIRAQPDMKLVGATNGDPANLMDACAEVDLLVLIAPYARSASDLCSQLLHAYPALKILVLATREDAAGGYWLDVRRCRIQPATDEKLIAGMRVLYGRGWTDQA